MILMTACIYPAYILLSFYAMNSVKLFGDFRVVHFGHVVKEWMKRDTTE